MSGAIVVENIRDKVSRYEQIDLRGMIRLEQNGLRATSEQEHHRERE